MRHIARVLLCLLFAALAIGLGVEIHSALGPGQMLAHASFLSATLTLLFYAVCYCILGAAFILTLRKLS